MMLPRVEPTIPNNKYGFSWWHKSYVVESEIWSVTFSVGNGGNEILIFADQNLVAVVTASTCDRPYMYRQIDEMLQKYILPAAGNPQ